MGVDKTKIREFIDLSARYGLKNDGSLKVGDNIILRETLGQMKPEESLSIVDALISVGIIVADRLSKEYTDIEEERKLVKGELNKLLAKLKPVKGLRNEKPDIPNARDFQAEEVLIKAVTRVKEIFNQRRQDETLKYKASLGFLNEKNDKLPTNEKFITPDSLINKTKITKSNTLTTHEKAECDENFNAFEIISAQAANLRSIINKLDEYLELELLKRASDKRYKEANKQVGDEKSGLIKLYKDHKDQFIDKSKYDQIKKDGYHKTESDLKKVKSIEEAGTLLDSKIKEVDYITKDVQSIADPDNEIFEARPPSRKNSLDDEKWEDRDRAGTFGEGSEIGKVKVIKSPEEHIKDYFVTLRLNIKSTQLSLKTPRNDEQMQDLEQNPPQASSGFLSSVSSFFGGRKANQGIIDEGPAPRTKPTGFFGTFFGGKKTLNIAEQEMQRLINTFKENYQRSKGDLEEGIDALRGTQHLPAIDYIDFIVNDINPNNFETSIASIYSYTNDYCNENGITIFTRESASNLEPEFSPQFHQSSSLSFGGYGAHEASLE